MFEADEVYNLRNAFYQGQFENVIKFDISAFEGDSLTTAKLYKYRAQLALKQQVSVEEDEPELLAFKALTEDDLDSIQDLLEGNSENANIQIISALAYFRNGKESEALDVLSRHESNLEAVALIVAIRLIQNRTDLARKEVVAAKKWAQDNIVIQLAEAWLDLRLGGDKYQEAYYIFEELASNTSTLSNTSLIGQALCDIHLGRLPEASTALEQALARDPSDINAIANSVVLANLKGSQEERDTFAEKLSKIDPFHPLIAERTAKSKAFDEAAAKYSEMIAA